MLALLITLKSGSLYSVNYPTWHPDIFQSMLFTLESISPYFVHSYRVLQLGFVKGMLFVPPLPYDPYCYAWGLSHSLSWVFKLRILPVLAIYTSSLGSEGSPTLGLNESSSGGPTFNTRDLALIFVSDENLLIIVLYFSNYLIKILHTKANR